MRPYKTDFTCTYCNDPSHGFYKGPEGGLAVNILCANPSCRHWFNDMGPFGVMDLEMQAARPTPAGIEGEKS